MDGKGTITFFVCDYVFCHEMTFFQPKSAHDVFFATLGFQGICVCIFIIYILYIYIDLIY
jgi:hypothetical protein